MKKVSTKAVLFILTLLLSNFVYSQGTKGIDALGKGLNDQWNKGRTYIQTAEKIIYAAGFLGIVIGVILLIISSENGDQKIKKFGSYFLYIGLGVVLLFIIRQIFAF